VCTHTIPVVKDLWNKDWLGDQHQKDEGLSGKEGEDGQRLKLSLRRTKRLVRSKGGAPHREGGEKREGSCGGEKRGRGMGVTWASLGNENGKGSGSHAQPFRSIVKHDRQNKIGG
jgi:hypothetical protein